MLTCLEQRKSCYGIALYAGQQDNQSGVKAEHRRLYLATLRVWPLHNSSEANDFVCIDIHLGNNARVSCVPGAKRKGMHGSPDPSRYRNRDLSPVPVAGYSRMTCWPPSLTGQRIARRIRFDGRGEFKAAGRSVLGHRA